MNQRILVAIALVSALLSSSAFAGKCQHGVYAAKSQMHGGQHDKPMKHVVKKIVAAVSKTGINAEQAQQVTDAINKFKMTMMKIKALKKLPLDAFKDDSFDKEAFMTIVMEPKQAKAAAKADLIASIYAILNAEQKKIFKRECTAPMVEKAIKTNMIKGHMMSGKTKCRKNMPSAVTDVEPMKE